MGINITEIKIKDLFNNKDFKPLTKEYARVLKGKYVFHNRISEDYYYDNEKNGSLKTLAVFKNDKLIGFGTILLTLFPHFDCYIAHVESIFISEEERKTNAGALLIRRLKKLAKDNNAVNLYFSAPYGSDLAEKYKKTLTPINILFYTNL